MGSIVASVLGSVASAVISSALGGGRDRDERPAPAPAPAPAAPPPQAARAPDAGVTRQNTAAALKGPGTQAGTFLSGDQGVRDDELNLGGNTLLGR